MKILVTGGAGFIGSHLVGRLIAEEHKVIVLDNFSTADCVNSQSATKKSKLVRGSIIDRELVESLIKNVDYVVHLAAAVGVANIMESPLRGLETNVLGSEIVISNCSKYEVPLLLTSSSEIYGKNDSDSLDELSDRIIGVPQKSRWSYSDAKAIEEAFAFAYAKERGLSVKIVRLFNTIGPGQKSSFGMVVPRIMQAAQVDADIIIHGDGLQTRCFMHVDDAVSAIIKAMLMKSKDPEVFNIGNPEEVTINDLAAKIKSLLNSRSRVVHMDYDEIFGKGFEDMRRRVPNIDKARKKLNWYPNYSIDAILKDIYEKEYRIKGVSSD